MNPIEAAKKAMIELRDETKDLQSGVIPSLLTIVSIQGRLVDAHWQLSEMCADAFRTYTETFLHRSLERARIFENLRTGVEPTDRLTVKDAEEISRLRSKDAYEAEVAASVHYERLQLLIRSLDRAISYAEKVAAAVKFHEAKPPSQ